MLIVLGVPGVDVGLAAAGQGEPARREPLEEGGGALDLVTGVTAGDVVEDRGCPTYDENGGFFDHVPSLDSACSSGPGSRAVSAEKPR